MCQFVISLIKSNGSTFKSTLRDTLLASPLPSLARSCNYYDLSIRVVSNSMIPNRLKCQRNPQEESVENQVCPMHRYRSCNSTLIEFNVKTIVSMCTHAPRSQCTHRHQIESKQIKSNEIKSVQCQRRWNNVLSTCESLVVLFHHAMRLAQFSLPL